MVQVLLTIIINNSASVVVEMRLVRMVMVLVGRKLMPESSVREVIE